MTLLLILLVLVVITLRLRLRSTPVHRAAEEFGDTGGTLADAGSIAARPK